MVSQVPLTALLTILVIISTLFLALKYCYLAFALLGSYHATDTRKHVFVTASPPSSPGRKANHGWVPQWCWCPPCKTNLFILRNSHLVDFQHFMVDPVGLIHWAFLSFSLSQISTTSTSLSVGHLIFQDCKNQLNRVLGGLSKPLPRLLNPITWEDVVLSKTPIFSLLPVFFDPAVIIFWCLFPFLLLMHINQVLQLFCHVIHLLP